MISIKGIPELTVIDPRIEYPKYTRNKKKKRISSEEYFMYIHEMAKWRNGNMKGL